MAQNPLSELTREQRAELYRHLTDAIHELEGVISTLEEKLEGVRQYSADEEIIKECLTKYRQMLYRCMGTRKQIDLSPTAVREYAVVHGEDLTRIAAKELGDAKYWPQIAEVNNIKDPFSIETGDILILPDIADREEESEEEEVMSAVSEAEEES